MKKSDTCKTAFVTPNGKYEYTVVPFGLVHGPSMFARYLADHFRSLPFFCAYLDDILIFSNSKEEHWRHIERVLQILQDEKLVAKDKRCHFANHPVEFLGYSEFNGVASKASFLSFAIIIFSL